MLSAFSRLWTVLKAALAIGLLAAGSLYSAQIIDRRGVHPVTAALAEPTTTGSIKPSRAKSPPKGPSNGR
jgi:hypothetical protein